MRNVHHLLIFDLMQRTLGFGQNGIDISPLAVVVLSWALLLSLTIAKVGFLSSRAAKESAEAPEALEPAIINA